MILEYKDKTVKENKDNEKQNDQKKQNVLKEKVNESQKNLLIDLSHDVKPKENSWVSRNCMSLSRKNRIYAKSFFHHNQNIKSKNFLNFPHFPDFVEAQL